MACIRRQGATLGRFVCHYDLTGPQPGLAIVSTFLRQHPQNPRLELKRTNQSGDNSSPRPPLGLRIAEPCGLRVGERITFADEPGFRPGGSKM
jgi:hypothetical protein